MIRDLKNDEEWAFFESFVTRRGPHSGRRPQDHRRVLDGVFWIARAGAQWCDLPEFFGKWSSVYRKFRRWTLSGLWDLLLDVLNGTEGVGQTVKMIDSTVIRVHHCAARAREDSETGSRALARWAFDQNSSPHQRRWSPRSRRHRTRPSLRLYRCSASPRRRRAEAEGSFRRSRLRCRCHPYRAGSAGPSPGSFRSGEAGEGPDHDRRTLCAPRKRIERCFNRLENWRRLATRYDKTAESYVGFVLIAAVRL